MGLVQKIFGTHSQHELKRIYPIADKVESYREEYGKLSDEQLRGKTKEFKERLSKGETLNDLLPEAYATVREAAKRVLGMEHYRVLFFIRVVLQRCVQVKVRHLYVHFRHILMHLKKREY
jgi:preprotein translocase subunit SecA